MHLSLCLRPFLVIYLSGRYTLPRRCGRDDKLGVLDLTNLPLQKKDGPRGDGDSEIVRKKSRSAVSAPRSSPAFPWRVHARFSSLLPIQKIMRFRRHNGETRAWEDAELGAEIAAPCTRHVSKYKSVSCVYYVCPLEGSSTFQPRRSRAGWFVIGDGDSTWENKWKV